MLVLAIINIFLQSNTNGVADLRTCVKPEIYSAYILNTCIKNPSFSKLKCSVNVSNNKKKTKHFLINI